ncbi:hypothetical protein [Actinoplanes sp. NBRC 103695]|uniref:hypothetical protein n=1 Tax=Actinoplanes sp. NBRC 103695 TaxID=3032202 RepID=UPI0024A5060A|nr:hypothetical protein [Actinoplanes sp. NBRC 103695]GLZ00787.1 hypothetical protein Acsp02_80390 [Actinoplanes sp. NBRC 103695]
MALDSGSVPDWIAGVGSLAAVASVLVAFRSDKRKAAREHHAALERERRAQAERITYYLEPSRGAYDERKDDELQPSRMRAPVDGGSFHYGEA